MNDDGRERVLARPTPGTAAGLSDRVGRIVERVRSGGDEALREIGKEIDAVDIEELEVGEAEFEAAGDALTVVQREAIAAAADNIRTFHRAQQQPPLDIETAPGVRCERLSRPLRSVGLYVPAGTAPLPSTALMLGIPAALAGCPVRILCSPPRKDGSVDPAVLYAARVANVGRVFRLGGAQAIAAMAYGTESVPKVEKVFGPGNAWVTEAKAQVDRDPRGAARDLPAGPSEVLVIADGNANPEFVAADLLAQAEHGEDSQAILVTPSELLADAVVAAVDRLAARLPRRLIIDKSLAHSRVIVVESVAAAIDVSNAYAPEHLILQVEDARAWLDAVEAAGSVFLGAWAPESVGDYCSGTNHVLPTSGYARRYSSLGLADFLRFMTVQELTREGLTRLGPIAETLAALEGLDAHALAVSERRSVIESEPSR